MQKIAIVLACLVCADLSATVAACGCRKEGACYSDPGLSHVVGWNWACNGGCSYSCRATCPSGPCPGVPFLLSEDATTLGQSRESFRNATAVTASVTNPPSSLFQMAASSFALAIAGVFGISVAVWCRSRSPQDVYLSLDA
mmetsp:Transcript_142334/g.246400  ORF Transcript_142334/g.246400 Transcript_142334/m.246400 type:complete len:141 (-) Transcript_142334:6-428(-)